MNHEISFSHVENDWFSALPIGNGVMGGMAYIKDNELVVSLNHYDIYYHGINSYTPKSRNPDYLRALKQRVGKRGADNCSSNHYNQLLRPQKHQETPLYSGTHQSSAGEMRICLNAELISSKPSLKLVIEEAKILVKMENESLKLEIEILVVKSEDVLLISIEQNGPAVVEVSLSDPEGAEKVCVNQKGDGTRAEYDGLTVYTWLKFFGVETKVVNRGNLVFKILSPSDSFVIACRVVIDDSKDCLATVASLSGKKEKHQDEWGVFWQRIHLTLPDTFLETLWYLHLYMLECSSGIGSRYSEQTCGLNGLWDIKRPTLWGSMWYWDVNIQETFWPTFSANQLHLAKAFCDSYLIHLESAREYTREIYELPGIALDYPHTFYNCIQPWCAQFLFWYYEYSGDVGFLKKIYPIFCEQIEFLKVILTYDDSGKMVIYPDISPEQGPVTSNSVITLASIKYLLSFTIESARILNRPQAESVSFRELLMKIPNYPVTSDGNRWRDSENAPDNLWLRHPSVLMPIYPAGEVDQYNDNGKERAIETLKFAMDNTEIGMFGFGWLAAAAARLGEGSAAVRIIYEKGLDFITHTNGLAYEETERWQNLCILTKPPLFLPAMMEPSGGLVNAVNEMLLQSHCHVIHVFPAIPTGVDNISMLPVGYMHEQSERFKEMPIWENCTFEGLLAKGNTVVSAQMTGGKINWIKLISQKAGVICVHVPEYLQPQVNFNYRVYKKNYLEIDSIENETFEIGEFIERDEATSEGVTPLVRLAHTNRRVFLGENRHTQFYKTIDAMTCPYGMANSLVYPTTQLKFDFSTGRKKDYSTVSPRQVNFATPQMILPTGYRQLTTADYYEESIGWGFSHHREVRAVDRGGPDDLRRDFLEGESPIQFKMNLPAGKYDLLVISGDEHESSSTIIKIGQNTYGGEKMAKGEYQCQMVPFIHEDKVLCEIEILSKSKEKWKLNGMILNKSQALY